MPSLIFGSQVKTTVGFAVPTNVKRNVKVASLCGMKPFLAKKFIDDSHVVLGARLGFD
jgi:hypothetical protein